MWLCLWSLSGREIDISYNAVEGTLPDYLSTMPFLQLRWLDDAFGVREHVSCRRR
jgi:hypothetical protein